MPERLPRHVLEGIAGDSRGRDLWDGLASLDIPVLVARGADGGMVTEEQAGLYRSQVKPLSYDE